MFIKLPYRFPIKKNEFVCREQQNQFILYLFLTQFVFVCRCQKHS